MPHDPELLLLIVTIETYGQPGTLLTLDNANISLTLSRLNEIRSTVTPNASNMLALVRNINFSYIIVLCGCCCLTNVRKEFPARYE